MYFRYKDVLPKYSYHPYDVYLRKKVLYDPFLLAIFEHLILNTGNFIGMAF